MVIVDTVDHVGSDTDAHLSLDAGPRGFWAVNNASNSESQPTSQDSFPHDRRNKHDHSSVSAGGQTYQTSHNREEQNDQHKEERRRSNNNSRPGSPHPYDCSPSKRAQPPHVADRALRAMSSTDQNGISHHGDHHSADHYGVSGPSHARHIHSSRLTASDAHPAKALQRETQSQVLQLPHTKTQLSTSDFEIYDPDSHDTITVVRPKQRRNFSKRTKTGCMTCRKRKKKCDEGRPRCHRCVRGGFECPGYNPPRGSSLCTTNLPVKVPMLLWSDDYHSEVPEPHLTYKIPHERSAHPMRTLAQCEGDQLRLIPLDDHESQRQQQQYVTSPPRSEAWRRPSSPSPQEWPSHQTPPTYNSERLPQTLHYLPPPTGAPPSHPPGPADQLHPLNRAILPPLPSSQPRATLTHHHPSPSGRPGFLGLPGSPGHKGRPEGSASQPECRSAASYPPERHTPTSHVRMSSMGYDPHKSGTKIFNKEDVERSKMLRGSTYNHFDTTLQNERKRCEHAIEKFNKASELHSGVSETETRKILLKVFDPTEDDTHKFLAVPWEKGALGEGVKIEAPFTCTYGYNIKTMDNVYIGKSCVIDDAGKVDIGPRTWIGPNVHIMTTNIVKNVQDRKGAWGAWVANGVTMASEVIIGANAVIYPGVTLGRGSTVEPFAVVKESLPAFTTQYAPVGKRSA